MPEIYDEAELWEINEALRKAKAPRKKQGCRTERQSASARKKILKKLKEKEKERKNVN